MTKKNYYELPSGIQVGEVSGHLTGNAAQAVQYIARSCRVDGIFKNDKVEVRIEDLHKAKRFLDYEINRLSGATSVTEVKE